MTDWKASLLEYLYLKTREVIQRGAFTKERASTLIPKVLQEVLHLLHSETDREKCGEFFSMMPPRYLLATPPAQIVRHVRLWEKFTEDNIVFEPKSLEREALNEVTLLTWENPALFSRMTGLFAAHNVNILEAQLNLSNKGHALQIFKVTDAEGKMIDDADRWVRIEKDLREVLEGRLPIENLVAEKFRPSLFKKKVAQIRPTRVDIDNDLSAYYTVIDIVTHDRLGLLYQITSTLSSLGLYVDVSKISTKVDQVADTFYVKDIFGHKITSEERLKKIREVMMRVIDEEPTPGWRPPTFT
jgi:[protein-PII] uridylyltransferase